MADKESIGEMIAKGKVKEAADHIDGITKPHLTVLPNIQTEGKKLKEKKDAGKDKTPNRR